MSKHSPNRNGSVLIVVLVCLGFAATVMMGALRTSLQQRRQLCNEHDSVQADWLLDAGVRLAIEELGDDESYSGQKVTLKQGLRSGQIGVVEIQVTNQSDKNDLVVVQVDAKLERAKSNFGIKRSVSFPFSVNKAPSQSSESPAERKP